MRILLAALLFIVGSSAFANSQIIFSKDGSRATITLLAFVANPDASLMFDSLAQAPQDLNGKLTKHIEFTTSDGVKSLSVECVFSKLSENTGSCILVLSASQFLQQDPAHARAMYQLSGKQAAALAGAFVIPPAGGEFYRSSDNHLTMSAVRGENGTIVALTLAYN